MSSDFDITRLAGATDSITRIKLGAGPNRQAGGVALGVIAGVVLLVVILSLVPELRWFVPWVIGGGFAFVVVYLGLHYAFAFKHPVAASLDSVDYARVLTTETGMMALPGGGSPLIDVTPRENPELAEKSGGGAHA